MTDPRPSPPAAAVDNGGHHVSFPAMRAARTFAALACMVVFGAACIVPDKDKEPEWRQAPKAFDPIGADLTFNAKNLEAFNAMSGSEREAHLAELMGKAGSFKGQAIFKLGTELGDKMDDAQWGRYEIYAVVPDPVVYEITVEYHLYSEQDLSTKLPPNGYIEFTGTLAEMMFQDESKPRKMEIKVKADSVSVISD